MLRLKGLPIVAVLSVLAAFGCRNDGSPNALAPDASLTAYSTQPETHRQAFTATLGTGTGHVNVTPTAEDQGTFHVQGEVHVLAGPANMTFFVQRAPDLIVDGTCTGPWITFPTPNPGPPVTLTTSPGGAGAAHFELGVAGPFVSGRQFNVKFRLIDNLTSPTTILETNCFTVTVK
jgi:hypothetical protein